MRYAIATLRAEWAKLRADTPLTLTDADLTPLQSLNDPISLDEVVEHTLVLLTRPL